MSEYSYVEQSSKQLPNIQSDFCCSFSSNVFKNQSSIKNDNSQNNIKNTVANDELIVHEKQHDFDQTVNDCVSREKIKALRKGKVKALKNKKKREKQEQAKQLENEIQGQTVKTEFSLHQNDEEFPTLSAAGKSKKISKIRSYSSCRVETDNTNAMDDKISCKTAVEKSWKPKIKDPICIDLGLALLPKPEKPKVVLTKKSSQSTQKNVVGGNILDSDNPQRKRGKVRPDKVQKPTKLKSLILSERTERQRKCAEDECGKEAKANHLNDIEVDLPFGDINNLSQNIIENNYSKQTSNNLNDQIKEQPNDQILTPLKNIHSRKFREYCTNWLTEDIITSCCQLLEKVALFQDRSFAKDPIKANAKRRYVAGLNQCKKYLMVKKVKTLVIAPDLEKNCKEGGLDEKIDQFKKEAAHQGIPCIFGPNRKTLGRAMKKKALVSCVAVLSYDGAEEQFSKVLEALDIARIKYESLLGQNHDTTAVDTDDELASNNMVPDVPVSADNVTLSLLAALRNEMSPTDKLINAIHQAVH